MDIAGKVIQAGSDEKSAAFQKEVLPELSKFLQGNLSEQTLLDNSRVLLDFDQLKLKTDSDVRVYFVGEGSGYQNTLGFNLNGKGISDASSLIFPNASSPVSTFDPSSNPDRRRSAPLLPGDFVSLGKLPGGSLLDFFLIAKGANGGTTAFSTGRSANPDGINHVVAFAYQKTNIPYLIIGFEDLLSGGDRDFIDLFIAVEMGAGTVEFLTAAPEPAMAATLLTFLGLTLRRRRTVSHS